MRFVDGMLLLLHYLTSGGAAPSPRRPFVLLDQPVAVGVEQVLQVRDLLLQLFPLVGVLHHLPVRAQLDDDGGGSDVGAFLDGLGGGLERLVLHEQEAARMVDQRVSGDARLRVVRPGEAPVDDQQLAVRLDGGLALDRAHGDVPVDDVPVLAGHPELVQELVADGLLVAQGVVGPLLLDVRRLVGDEAALEGGHLALVEEGGVLAAPEVPRVVEGEQPLVLVLLVEVGGAHQLVHLVHQGLPLVRAPLYPHLLEGAVGVHGHRRVEEQVGVAHLVQAPVAEQAAHVLAQLLAPGEGTLDAVQHLLLLGGEPVGVRGVERGEALVPQLVRLPVQLDRPGLRVDAVQQQPVLHRELRPSPDDLPLELVLDDGDGLVHLRDEAHRLLVVRGLIGVQRGDEELAGVVGVRLHGEGGEGQQVDAVAVLEGRQVAVPQAHPHDVGDAPEAARGRPHPEDVVVAPLDVEVVVSAQGVHDDVRPRSPVVDVPDDVQLVDGEPLDEVADGNDEVVRPSRGDDGADDLVHVGRLVRLGGGLVQELLDDVGELGGQRLAYLGAGVLGGDVAADLDQLVQRDHVPVVQVLLGGLDEDQLLLGVIDERAQLLLLRVPHRVVEDFPHLPLDGAGRVAEHVAERLVLAVDVGEEMLRALGQVQDGFQVDDFRAGVRDGREAPGEQLQVAQVGRDFFHGDFFRHVSDCYGS